MRARTELWGVLAALVLLGVLALWTGPVPIESAFVSYDYARSVATGHGLVFNDGGSPTEAYQSLLWVWICSAMFAVGLDAPCVAPYLSLLLGALCVVLLFDLLRRRAEQEAQWLVPLLLFASSASLVMISMTGTDASLFSLLLLGCAWSLDRLGDRPSPVLTGLLALAAVLLILCRFEGVVAAAAAAILLLPVARPRAQGRRRAFAAAGVIAVAAVVYHGWRVATFGAFVPDFVILHLGVNDGVFQRVQPFDTVPFGALYLMVAILAAVGFKLGRRSAGERFGVTVALMLGVLYLVIEDPTPALSNHAALLALAIVPWPYVHRAVLGSPNQQVDASRRVRQLLIAAVLLIGIGIAADNRVTTQRFQESHRETLRPLGEWLADWRPNLTLATDRPGAISYYANGKTLDLRQRSRLGAAEPDRALALAAEAPDVVLLTARGQTKIIYDPGSERFRPALKGYYIAAALRMSWSYDRSVVMRMRGDIPPPENTSDTFPHGIGFPFFGWESQPPE
jgi:hypothetical protein